MGYFNFKNHQICYELTGTGKPILILNGIMMNTWSWAPFMDTLNENNSVLRVDFIDQGRSEKAKMSYTQDTQAELVYELLNHLNIEKISIFGISYGGEVALHFVLNYPDKVDRLLLFNTTAKTNDWLKDIGKGWILTGRSRNGEAYYKQTIPVIYSPSFYQKNIKWMKDREALLTPLFTNADFLDAMERLTLSAEAHDVRDRLSEIDKPTLIVSCGEDYLVPVSEQEYLRANIKGSSLVHIPNSGHASMYEVPLLFVALLLGFVNAKDTEYKV